MKVIFAILKDTGITVEMVVTDAGCGMNQISFSTGAEFKRPSPESSQKCKRNGRKNRSDDWRNLRMLRTR